MISRYQYCEEAPFRRWRKLFVPVDKLLSFDYLRESPYTTSNPYQTIQRRKRAFFGDQYNGLIGYTTIEREGPYLFRCLLWWLKTYDRPIDPEGVYKLPPELRGNPKFQHWGPCEAVDPARVLSFFPELMQEGC